MTAGPGWRYTVAKFERARAAYDAAASPATVEPGILLSRIQEEPNRLVLAYL